MDKYLNTFDFVPYNRNFIMINGERSIGKTYGTIMRVIKYCKKHNAEYIYLVRTQDQKNNGVFEESHKKVLDEQFKGELYEFTNDEMRICYDETKVLLGYCLALSEAHKIKLLSFPRVRFIIFDEYMLEAKSKLRYVNGWKEPDLLLSIYHTVDREQDRVTVFMLGNNTSFYNPYHLHPAFNVPYVNKGKMWMSENVLFYWAVSSEELKLDKAKSKFLRMIGGTSYGEYAKDGNYVDDNTSFIKPMTSPGVYIMTLKYEHKLFGVYSENNEGLVYITSKIDTNCKFIYALSLSDHEEGTALRKTSSNAHLKWLSRAYKNGCVRFDNMKTKTFIEKGMVTLL